MDTVRVGAKGTIVIPHELREKLGIATGSLMLIDVCDREMRLRPAVPVPVETYSKERQALFILNDAIDAPSYEQARERVRALGVDPDSIKHDRPAPLPSLPAPNANE